MNVTLVFKGGVMERDNLAADQCRRLVIEWTTDL